MLEKETKGALRYMEVDAAGERVDRDHAKVGNMYIRRTAFNNGDKPNFLKVEISATEID
jgi:hypothetical protein